MGASSLPTWDLTDLFESPEDPAIAKQLEQTSEQARLFQSRYAGTLANAGADELAEAIKTYETLEDTLGKLGSYAQLLYAENMTRPEHAQFYQNIQERLTEISTHLLFFPLEINKLEDDALEMQLQQSEILAHYAPWLRLVRAYKPYQLDDKIEQTLHEKSVTGHAAWNRLFDETIAQMQFKVDGKSLSSAEALNLLSHKKEKKRKAAAKAVGKSFKKQAHIFTLITNTLAKDKEIEDTWRGFKAPISARNVSNDVEDEVVEALLSAVQNSYGTLSHRYYALKTKWLGKKKLQYWNRNAPLPFADDSKHNWDDAKTLVLDAYHEFSPEIATIGKQFFDENWIDVPTRAGKAPGAFAHPTVPSAHPYLLLNYQGKTRDVMTLAHELGHGVHQVLAAEQGALMADTPLTLAETASVFGEQLVFQELVRREQNAERRKALIAGKVEDMLNTVVRQIAFCDFEMRIHTARRQGELTTEQINSIWLEVQRESLGDTLKFDENYGYYWCYIPHFIHSAFYVYAYAFGDCLVNALYAHYQQEKQVGRADIFAQNYITMLKAGGSLHHKELLAPFQIDISKPSFWQQGLDIISNYIDELEQEG